MSNIFSDYDVIFVGGGTANVFGCLNLISNNYKGKVLILEKGDGPDQRKPKDVTSGWFGAGLYSDAKIILSPYVGGEILEYLDKKHISEIQETLLNFISHLSESKLDILQPDDKDKDKLKPFDVLVSPVLHLGTDYGRILSKKMYSLFINSGIDVKCNHEVVDITEDYIVTCSNGEVFKGNNIIYGVGKSGVNLTKQLIDKFKIYTKPKVPQLGVRVEVPFEIAKKFTDKYYDFKFILHTEHGDVRSFCVSPKGEVIQEIHGEYITFNGGSNKVKKTDKTNWGILCTPKNIKTNVMEYQNNYIKECNEGYKELSVGWNDFNNIIKTTSLKNYQNIYNMIVEWCLEFDKLSPGFLKYVNINIPEAKLSTDSILLDKNFKIKDNNIYVVGDSSIARGIYQSALSGIHATNSLLGK